MRIVHVNLTGPVTDGWNYQDNLLAKYHRRNGHEVYFITSKWCFSERGKLIKDNRSEYISANGINVIRLEIKGKDDFNRKFKRFIGFEKALEIVRPDIIFIHNVTFVDIKIIYKYLKSNNKVVAYVDNHADVYNSAKNWLSRNVLHRLLWRRYLRRLIPYVKNFYGVLPARVEFLKDIYRIPNDKCKLLLLGADDDLVKQAKENVDREAVRRNYNINKDDFLIVSGGKIDSWKYETIILMRTIKEISDPKIKLIIFGSVSDELSKEFDSLIEDGRIQFIGWMSPEKIYQFFRSADLVVFLGHHSVMWEQAVAVGIPMIVRKWQGITHVDLGGNIIFLSKEEFDKLGEIICAIKGDEKKYSLMKKIAEEKGATIFSYDRISKQSIANCYKQI